MLAEQGLTADDWRTSGAHKVKGTRRALRFASPESAASAGADEHGPYVELRFVAPPGCYATALLREVMKTEPAEREDVRRTGTAREGRARRLTGDSAE